MMTGTDGTRGVSEVISVVLLVAVTVVLAATVGAYFLTTSQPVEKGVQAGADVRIGGGDVAVSFVDAQGDGTRLEVTLTEVSDGSGTPMSEQSVTLSSPGETKRWSGADVTGLGKGDEVRVLVVAINDAQRTVVLDRTGTV